MPSDVMREPLGSLTPPATPAARPGFVADVRRRASDWLTARAMFVVAVSGVLMISLLGIPTHFSQDGWLALIAGRLIAGHGIPQHDYFAVLTHGVRWVDQQWLAQWLMYAVTRVGGLPLLCVTYVLITMVAFSGAIAAARRLGGQDLHVLMATLPGAFFYLATALSIRTQGLAYPLFVTTLWLFASDLREHTHRARTYWVFPLLTVWGNLHGSVTLGVGLTMLYGGLRLLADVRRDGLRTGLRDIGAYPFLLLAPLTLLLSPYGTGIIHYYRATLMNPAFSRMVTEWKPVTSVPLLAIPLLVTVAVVLVAVVRAALLARAGRVSPPELFSVLTLGVLAVGAVIAVRNITWFGLALIVLLPAILTQVKGGGPAPLRRSRVNRLIAVATLALSVLVTGGILAQRASWFTRADPSRAIPTLRAILAARPHARILADVRYADWLIWEDPATFSGRVAYDTSFELLTQSQLAAISDLAARSSAARSLVREFPVWMLYPGNHHVNRLLLRRPGVRVVRRTRTFIIAVHGPGQGG